MLPIKVIQVEGQNGFVAYCYDRDAGLKDKLDHAGIEYTEGKYLITNKSMEKQLREYGIVYKDKLVSGLSKIK